MPWNLDCDLLGFMEFLQNSNHQALSISYCTWFATHTHSGGNKYKTPY